MEKIILDTDITADCDDVGAIAVLHTLAGRGDAEILGMICNTTSPWGAPCLQAMNTWLGRPAIPIGTLKGPGHSGTSPDWPGETYNRTIAQTYPNSLGTGERAEDATVLYRRLLSGQPDGSVTIISIGMLTCLRDLLVSPPDQVSPLAGRDLVRRKVRLLSVMAGRHPGGGPECNLVCDVPAAVHVAQHWPTPTVWNGCELGEQVQTGARLAELPPEDIIRRGYQLWCNHFEPRWRKPHTPDTLYPHCSFDQLSVLYAIPALAQEHFTIHPGCLTIAPDGSCQWQEGSDHHYLKLRSSTQTLATLIDDLMLARR